MQLLAVIDFWHVSAVYLANEFCALFVKREIYAFVAVIAIASVVIRHDSSHSCCIVGKTLTCISCIVRNRDRRLPDLSLLAIPSTGGIGARVALLG